ncbi:translesion error-prone DNA polymerase V autoproteolytic subunit [bacterium]|nr:translesion error-prone DNA polymerase V autoproteolytic subunit [bacterium]
MSKKLTVTHIASYDEGTEQKFPMYGNKLSAGFPSPADDFLDKKIDLNEHLIKHPAATFFIRVEGDSMIHAGVFSGDTLIVDRSLQAANGKVVVAVLNGEFLVKRLKKIRNKIFLEAENPKYDPIEITESMPFEIWGVVTTVIHPL